MSASTGTIQRPAAQGSIFGAVAMTIAALLAAGSLAWGVATLNRTTTVTTPVQAPAMLDKGSRDELAAPAAKPVTDPNSILDRGGRGDVGLPGAQTVPDRGVAPRTNDSRTTTEWVYPYANEKPGTPTKSDGGSRIFAF